MSILLHSAQMHNSKEGPCVFLHKEGTYGFRVIGGECKTKWEILVGKDAHFVNSHTVKSNEIVKAPAFVKVLILSPDISDRNVTIVAEFLDREQLPEDGVQH